MFTTLAKLALTISLAHAAEVRNPYCGDPDYQLMSAPPSPVAGGDFKLVNEQEKQDPEIGRKLAFRPAAYGHSELGYRYLARLLGYPGEFTGRHAVEDWIAANEDPGLRQSLADLWEKWAVQTNKRLGVPGGAMSAAPNDADPSHFFVDKRDRDNHERCIRTELAKIYCERSAGEKIQPGDPVYYGKARLGSRPDVCIISERKREYWAKRPDSTAVSSSKTYQFSGMTTSITSNTKIERPKPAASALPSQSAQ